MYKIVPLTLGVAYFLLLFSSCSFTTNILMCPHHTPQYVDLVPGYNTLNWSDGQYILVYLPSKLSLKQTEKKLLVIIHGYLGEKTGKDAEISVQRRLKPWTSFAENHNFVLVGPLFDNKRFSNNYQRLNIFGLRADLRLNEIVEYIMSIIPGVCSKEISLFGFSGGGQFVHRYVAFHPDKIRAAVAAGSGWYMWPKANLPYPLGYKLPFWMRTEQPEVTATCHVPLLVLVGENDIKKKQFRQFYRGYNLNKNQGYTRLVRAQNWYLSLQNVKNNQECLVDFQTIPHTGHQISQRLLFAAQQYILSKE